MARRLFIFLNIFFILIATTTSLAPKPKPKPKPHTFVLPVLRDTNTGIYYTNVTIGQPPLVVNMVVHVSGEAIWFQCVETDYKSTTYTPIHCKSPKCKQNKGECADNRCYGSTCGKDTCLVYFYGSYGASLFEDNVILSYTSSSPSSYVASNLTARVPLSCMSPSTSGLPSGVLGNLGLGSSSKSFVNSLVSSFKIPFKVALCLPSKPGSIGSGLAYIGGGPYLLNRKDVSGLLVSTPLIRVTNEDAYDSYYIDVKSIEVNGKTLSFDKSLLTLNRTSKRGGTEINTIPYTFLEPSIYKALVKAFAGNAKKQKAVYPFNDCFSSTSFGGKLLFEKEIPVITLVLAGGVKWNIYGPNSLVKINKNVVCLAFRDGSGYSTAALDIGGYQMQDNLVEFDLEASKFSFTSSLLLHNTSCSRL